MARNNSKTIDEVQIRQLIDCWACSIRDKNIEAAVFHYARDILLYDLAPPSRCLFTWTGVTRRRSISSPDRLADGAQSKCAAEWLFITPEAITTSKRVSVGV